MVLLSRNPNNCICRQQPEAVGRGASGSWGTPPPSLLNRVRNLMLGQDNLDKNVEEFILHSQTELQQHVMQHIKQYEAMMMIIGRLAGIPACGTPEEIKAARDAVEAALKNLNEDLANRSKREGWSGYTSPLDLFSLGLGYYYQGYGTVEEWFGDAIGVEGIKNSGRSNQNIGEGLVATDPDKYIKYAISDFLTSVWSSAEQYYNNFLKEVETNGFLIAYGKLHIDAGFLAAELAIDIALGAVTGGAGAAASRIIRVVGTRAGRTATRVVVKIGKQSDGVIPNGRILLDEIVDDVDIPNDIDIIIDENNLGGGARLDDALRRREPNPETPETTIVRGDADLPPPPTSGRMLSKAERKSLRSRTATRNLRDMVNEGQPLATPINPQPDPWLPGMQRTARLEADHIVPADRIMRMDGFSDLPKADQIDILNLQENFHGLSRSANSSRGNKSFTEWIEHASSGTQVDTALRQRMIPEETRLTEQIQRLIYDRLRQRQSEGAIPVVFRSE